MIRLLIEAGGDMVRYLGRKSLIAAGSGLLAVVVVVGTVIALRHGDGARDRAAIVVAPPTSVQSVEPSVEASATPSGTPVPSATDAPASSSPSATPEVDASVTPSPTPSGSSTPRTSPTPTAIRTPAPATSTYVPPVAFVDPSFGPMSPGTVSIPYSKGQTSWSGTSRGFAISVTMSPAAPRTGEVVTFHIEVSNPAMPGCCNVAMLFGDGYDVNNLKCTSGAGDRLATDVQHVYNRSGRIHFLITVNPTRCTANYPDGSLLGWFDMDKGTVTAQGPEKPVVQVDSAWWPEAPDISWMKVFASASDADGQMSRFEIDYGDGSPIESYKADTMKCQPSLGGWPLPSRATLPAGNAHHFTKPGTYTITVTAWSTGCDGSMPQSGKASFVYVVP